MKGLLIMKCSKCGKNLEDGFVYCPKCGNHVEMSEEDRFINIRLSHENQENSTVSLFSQSSLQNSGNIICLRPGTLLHGRYTVSQVLGNGGFGITYSGEDSVLARKIAIKEFFPNNLITRNNS